MATIYDVAKTAGVSPKTVSRVLNGDAPVGASTRKVVESAMAELGYVRSTAARNMRSSRTGLIGLITGAISTAAEPGRPTGLPELVIVQGIQAVLAEAGKTLMIADTAGQVENAAPLMRTFREHRVDGLIYVADFHKEVALPDVVGETPLILANCFDTASTSAVLPDDRSGQHALTTDLIAAGHRRIAYLGLSEDMVATRLRLQGYRDALATAGIAYDPELVATGYRTSYAEDGSLLEDALSSFQALDDRPSVICCGNDEMAMRVYGILRTRGLTIPENISVAGYDNHRVISETLFPPLTTVTLAYREMGMRAARRLLDLIDGARDVPAHELVPGPVVWRESVTGHPT